jgi:hypothetical protein
MSKKYEVKTIGRVERLGVSACGNPYFAVHFADGTTARTRINSPINYGLESSGNLNVPVAVYTTKAGRVWDIVPLDKLKEDDSKYRWIVYLNQPVFGSFDVERVESIEAAKAALVRYGNETYVYEQATATLYPYSTEDWAEAVEYREIGCPFDYPSKQIERGPRDGVKVTNA